MLKNFLENPHVKHTEDTPNSTIAIRHNRRTIEAKRQATSIYRISLASKGIFPVPPFSVDRQDNDRIHHLGHHYSK